jgi:multidrug efflux pump subunit AcrA (membrane-fusion protein)
MQVEIDVPNDKYRLQPGMYADVELHIQSHDDALTVPVQAVRRHNGKASVLLVDANDRVQVRDIVTGLEDPNRIEVLRGLQEGDHVIMGNFDAYQPGERVTPKPSQFAAVATGGAE